MAGPCRRGCHALGSAISVAGLAMIVDLNVCPAIERQALDLAIEMRSHLLRSVGRGDLRATRLRFWASERIQQVVAWGLYQKALRAGELTPAEIRENLKEMIERSGEPPALDGAIDPELRSLVERSRSLFQRVQRLAKDASASRVKRGTPRQSPHRGRVGGEPKSLPREQPRA